MEGGIALPTGPRAIQVVELTEKLSEVTRRLEALEAWTRAPVRLSRDGRPIHIRLSVPDKTAAREIREFLASAAGAGRDRVGLLDLVTELRLPPDQVRRLMDSLSSEGVERVD